MKKTKFSGFSVVVTRECSRRKPCAVGCSLRKSRHTDQTCSAAGKKPETATIGTRKSVWKINHTAGRGHRAKKTSGTDADGYGRETTCCVIDVRLADVISRSHSRRRRRRGVNRACVDRSRNADDTELVKRHDDDRFAFITSDKNAVLLLFAFFSPSLLRDTMPQ